MEVVQAEIPDWLADSAPDEPAEPVEVAVPEIPGAAEDEDEGWLEGMESEDVPGWLLETLSTGEQEAVAIEEGQALLMETEPQAESVAPAPAPAPQPATPAPVGLSPAPVPVAAADIDVEATLNNARSKVAEKDVNAGLEDYEAIVRANVQLDTVVADLQALMKEGTHKMNPAVYRVLGDALMRQGQLQAALDTYRRALNLL